MKPCRISPVYTTRLLAAEVREKARLFVRYDPFSPSINNVFKFTVNGLKTVTLDKIDKKSIYASLTNIGLFGEKNVIAVGSGNIETHSKSILTAKKLNFLEGSLNCDDNLRKRGKISFKVKFDDSQNGFYRPSIIIADSPSIVVLFPSEFSLILDDKPFTKIIVNKVKEKETQLLYVDKIERRFNSFTINFGESVDMKDKLIVTNDVSHLEIAIDNLKMPTYETKNLEDFKIIITNLLALVYFKTRWFIYDLN